MESKSWILVGMMGCGKSTVGRLLSEVSEREFFDTDQIIQYKFGRPIPQIFSIYGEESFRDYETVALRGLSPSESVVSTGGGIVLRDENWIEMERLGITIYLRSSLENIVHRLRASKKRRPLIETENWEDRVEEILKHRSDFYEKAKMKIDVDGLEKEAIVSSIIATMKQYDNS